MVIRHVGRNERKAKKGGRGGYCRGCDANIIKKGQRCSVCGRLEGVQRYKKPLPPFDLD